MRNSEMTREQLLAKMEELQESEVRYRKLSLLSSDFLHCCVRRGLEPYRISWLGGAVEQVTGYTYQEVEARGCWIKFLHPEDMSRVGMLLLSCKPGAVGEQEFRIIHKDGGVRWLCESYRCETGDSPDELRLYGAIRDVTERRDKEWRLRMAMQSLETTHECVHWIDVHGRILYANPAMEAELGHCADELRRLTIPDIDPNIPEGYFGPAGELMRSKPTGVKKFETLHRHRDGRLVQVEVDSDAFQLDGQTYFIAIARNITERKRAEEELVNNQRRLAGILSWKESIINNSAVGILVVTENRIITEVNRGFLEMFGFSPEELIGQSVSRLHVDQKAYRQFGERFWAVADRRKAVVAQWPMRRENGEIFWCELTGCAINSQNILQGVVWVIIDISERRRMQEAMIQTEKMMSVGGLAAGMAHEINNPLGGILQNVQVIQRRLTQEIPKNIQAAKESGCSFEAVRRFMEKRDIPACLEAVREAGGRAARIVSSMLEFSRAASGPATPADLHSLLDKSLELSATDYNLKKKYDFRNIRVTKQYHSGLPPVPCSDTQIQQVFMNLLANAAQAMAQTASPAIVLRTALEDDWARIEIEDNGPGMSAAVRKRVFEPFFTTKPVGEGTGLGLSVSYFIVCNNHHGAIEALSEPGRGARFTIRLPLGSGSARNAT